MKRKPKLFSCLYQSALQARARKGVNQGSKSAKEYVWWKARKNMAHYLCLVGWQGRENMSQVIRAGNHVISLVKARGAAKMKRKAIFFSLLLPVSATQAIFWLEINSRVKPESLLLMIKTKTNCIPIICNIIQRYFDVWILFTWPKDKPVQ